jgi:MFS family permease
MAVMFLAGLSGPVAAPGRAKAGVLVAALGALVVAIGLVAIPAFLQVEARMAAPMLDLRLFRQRLFTFGVISSLLSYTVNFIVIFLMPFYLLAYRHFPADRAGIILTAMSVVMALVTPVAGGLSDRIGSRFLASGGMAVLGLAAGLFAGLGPGSPLLRILLPLGLAGLGLGMFVSPNNSAIMGASPAPRRGIAAGVMALSRNTGMLLGVASGGYFLTALGGSAGKGAISPRGFPVAFHWAMLAAAVLALTGAVLSFGRGRPEPAAPQH